MTPAPFDYTLRSDRNRSHPTKIIEVRGGARFVVLDITQPDVERFRDLLYMHVNRINRKFYIGRTTMLAGDRFNQGHGYRLQEAMAAAIRHHGWQTFDTYILALGDDDASLSELEVQAIKDSGGHKSHNSYNMSPGGEIVADNGKPIICVHMPTMKETEYESATACGLALGIHPDGVAAVARGDIHSRGSARRQNIGDYYFYFKGELPHYPEHWGNGARARRIAEKLGRPIVAINYNDPSDRRRFNSTGEAASALGLHQSAVSQVVLGNVLSAGNWFFHLEDEPRELPAARGSAATRVKRDVAVYAVNLKTGKKRCIGMRLMLVRLAVLVNRVSPLFCPVSENLRTASGSLTNRTPSRQRGSAKHRCASTKSSRLWQLSLARAGRLPLQAQN